MRILHVDSDSFYSKLLETQLNRLRDNVDFINVSNLQDAYEKHETEEWDLLIVSVEGSELRSSGANYVVCKSIVYDAYSPLKVWDKIISFACPQGFSEP